MAHIKIDKKITKYRVQKPESKDAPAAPKEPPKAQDLSSNACALKTEIGTSHPQLRIAGSFGPAREGIDLVIRASRAVAAALVLRGPTIPAGRKLL